LGRGLTLPSPLLLRHFHERHLQIRECILQHGGLFVGQIPARLFLDHPELVDEHFGQLQVHFALPRLRVWNLPEKKRGILRLHHDKLDEALRHLAQ